MDRKVKNINYAKQLSKHNLWYGENCQNIIVMQNLTLHYGDYQEKVDLGYGENIIFF